MTWSCMACTFENKVDDSVVCAICGTRRKTQPSTSTTGFRHGRHLDLQVLESQKHPCLHHDGITTVVPTHSKALQQRTLFGGIATNLDRPTKEHRQKKKPRIDDRVNEKWHGESSEVSMDRKVSNAPYNVLKQRANDTMKAVFGIDELRNLQPIAVKMALQRKSQIIVMATGGGKSLCYQLPASVLGGVTLVVSPLIALMVDQVQALNSKGIEAALLSSATGERNNLHVLERLLGRSLKPKKKDNTEPPLKPLKLVYCTPELLQTQRFRDIVVELHEKKCLALVAIDEAHCLSTWGHDFRPAYRKLGWLSTFKIPIPIMACTATATPKVIQDIRETLALLEDAVPCHLSSFNRPNISYEVRFKDSLDAMRHGGALGDLLALIKDEHSKSTRECSGIVYVHKRDDTTFIAKQITVTTGIPAAAYHAGLKDAERSLVQGDWTSGKVKVAVATVAFGMGIDLAHVRYVLHWTLPKTVEGFYQESGRAGRDGERARSVLYYSKDDASRFAFIIRKGSSSKATESRGEQEHYSKAADRTIEALEKMINYCMIPGCRRQFLLGHFGEVIHPKDVCCKTCDFCENPAKVRKDIQASDVVKDVLKSVSKYASQIKNAQEWDGQWLKPHGDDEMEHDDMDERWEGDLRITASGNYNDSEIESTHFMAHKRNGFKKAISVLNKYERMETKEGADGGFVKFHCHDGPCIQYKPIEIPLHLREGLPDPLGHLSKPNSTGNKKSSAELAHDIRVRQEKLQKLKEHGRERLASLNAIPKLNAVKPPPPAPPSLALTKPRK